MLAQASQRLRHDLEHRVFFVHPFHYAFAHCDLKGWLGQIGSRISSGKYVFSPAPAFDVPKARLATRPGLAISLDDQLAYHWLAINCLPQLAERIRWSEYTVRFSYRLRDDGATWFKQSFAGWKNFDHVSLGKLSKEFRYVITTDVSAYYENIDIRKLVLHLKAESIPEAVCGLLSEGFHKWAGQRERGIPQAYSPSHMFGEFFLDDIDRELAAEGITHLRYLDDIRIFASSSGQAHRHLNILARLLRARGLNLQNAKTELLSRVDAKRKFRRVHAAIGRAARRIASQMVDVDPYVSPEELQAILAADPDNPRPEVVGEAWDDFVKRRIDRTPTVFHYLLARLSETRSPAAAEYCVEQLADCPEETAHILKYFSSVLSQLSPKVVESVGGIVGSESAIYDYQRYQLLRWFLDNDVVSSELLAMCRRAVSPGKAHRIVRPYAIAYLARFTTEQHDFERLERLLEDETDDLGRATLVHALRKASAAIRSRVLGRCKGESWLMDQAINCPMQI